MRASTRLRTFYALLLSQTISLIGSQMTALVLAIHVTAETGNATPIALVSFFNYLPRIISVGFAGVFADRYDRRLVMALADTGQVVGTLALLATIISGTFQPWHLYVFTLFQAVLETFQGPAMSASITMLIPDEHRDRANALRNLRSPTALVIAPALAGVLFATIGIAGVIAIDILSYFVAVGTLLFIHIPMPEQSDIGKKLRGSFWKESISGFRFLNGYRPLLGLVLYIGLMNFFFSGPLSVIVPYILARNGGDEVSLGVVMSIFSLGTVVGNLVMMAWGGLRPRIRLVMPGGLLIGVMLALYGMSREPITLAASLFVMMFVFAMVSTAIVSIMQVKVPADVQGRVFAAMGQISMLLLPLAYLLAGPLADNVLEPAVGQSGWQTVAPLVGNTPGAGMGLMAVGGALAMMVLSIVFYAIPQIRRMEAILPDYNTGKSKTNEIDVEAMTPTPIASE